MEHRLKVSILTRDYMTFEHLMYRKDTDIDEVETYLKNEIENIEIFMTVVNRLKRARETYNAD